MTREEAETVIWEQAAALNSDYTPDRHAAMEKIMAAADAYATAQCLIAIRAPDVIYSADHQAALWAATRNRRRGSPRKAAS